MFWKRIVTLYEEKKIENLGTHKPQTSKSYIKLIMKFNNLKKFQVKKIRIPKLSTCTTELAVH